MTFDQAHGVALQLRGELEKRWAAVTGDEVLALEASKHVFLGKLRQRSGEARERLERALTALLARMELSKQRRGLSMTRGSVEPTARAGSTEPGLAR